MENLKVSINIITKDRGSFLKEAIDSILIQSFKDWEIVIIDNKSKDNTKEIVEDHIKKGTPIKYLYQTEDLGISESRNLALNESDGEYVAVLDSDDVWCDEKKLEKQIKFLDSNTDHVLVGGNVVLIDKNSKEIGEVKNLLDNKKIKSKILFKNQFSHSGVLFRKDETLDVGGYDESLEIGEDYDLWLRLGLKGKIANLEEKALKYRVHSGNICSKKRDIAFKNNIRIIKKYKKDYDNYIPALIRRKIRYALYNLIPFKS